MFFRKKPSSRPSKQAGIHKDVIEHIKDTQRKIKEKIVYFRGKKRKGKLSKGDL